MSKCKEALCADGDCESATYWRQREAELRERIDLVTKVARTLSERDDRMTWRCPEPPYSLGYRHAMGQILRLIEKGARR